MIGVEGGLAYLVRPDDVISGQPLMVPYYSKSTSKLITYNTLCLSVVYFQSSSIRYFDDMKAGSQIISRDMG